MDTSQLTNSEYDDNALIMTYIMSCDIGKCREYFKEKPLYKHTCDFNFLNTAIKTCNSEVIAYVTNVLSEVYDSLCYNIGEVNIVFMAENRMYREFHKLTLHMAAAKPDYSKDFVTKLTQSKSQITDSVMLAMIDTIVSFLKEPEPLSRE